MKLRPDGYEIWNALFEHLTFYRAKHNQMTLKDAIMASKPASVEQAIADHFGCQLVLFHSGTSTAFKPKVVQTSIPIIIHKAHGKWYNFVTPFRICHVFVLEEAVVTQNSIPVVFVERDVELAGYQALKGVLQDGE